MNPFSLVDPALASAKAAAGSVDGALQFFEHWRKLRVSRMTTLKMLYLELDRNLEILDLIRPQSGKKNSDALWKDKNFPLLVNKLESQVTELILMNEDKYNVFKKLMRRGRFGRRDESGYENVMQALSFVHSKIHALKALVQCQPTQNLKRILLAPRLENVTERINRVMKVLSGFPEVNILARRWHDA
jgi:hypothetical protein